MKNLMFAAFVALFTLNSCEKEKVSTGTVNVKFNNVVGQNSETLGLNNNRVYNHPSNYKFSFSEFKYFISQIELFHANGDTIKLLERPFLVDAKRSETLNIRNIIGVKAGLMNGVRIVFGLRNNETPNGEKQSYIEEMLQGGKYLNFRAEGKFDVNETNSGGKDFKVIKGKTSTKNNTVVKDFIQSFILTNTIAIEFKIDVNEIFSNPNLINIKEFDRGLVDTDEAQNKIAENIVNAISITVIE
ncbi:MAG: hypothetical protein RLZZ414_470 [Bacteroidota bacterium]|jgi:hypothetical protein